MSLTQQFEPHRTAAAVVRNETQPKALRLAVQEDEAEALRLTEAMAAENGVAVSREKFMTSFDKAMRRDRMALVVIGTPDHLQGMVLFGFQYPWFADGARMALLTAFVEPEHRGSAVARALLRLSRLPLNQLEAALEQLAGGGG
jgi:hypothetical protein